MIWVAWADVLGSPGEPCRGIISKRDAFDLDAFGYDALGHETSNVWYDGPTTSYTEAESIAFGYDANGNMTLAQDVVGAVTTA